MFILFEPWSTRLEHEHPYEHASTLKIDTMVPGCASSLRPNLPKASQRRGHRFSKHAPLWQCMIPASGCSIPQSLRFLRYVRYLELHLWHQKETFQSFHIIVRGPYWLLMSWVGGLQTSGVRAPLPSCEKTLSDVTWHAKFCISFLWDFLSRVTWYLQKPSGAKTIKHDATSCADFATHLQSHKVWQRCRVVD